MWDEKEVFEFSINSDATSGEDTDDDWIDSSEEEQVRRFQELENKIGHRPPIEELIEKNIYCIPTCIEMKH